MIKNRHENGAGVWDLKRHLGGVKYALETINLLQKKAETILMKETIEEVKERISKLVLLCQIKNCFRLRISICRTRCL